ncbi:MAG: MFS transporter [Pseudomonadota bacterium]
MNNRTPSPRNFWLILLANIVLGAPMPMLILLGGLAGAHLSPTPFAATVPPTVQMLAGILVATPISLFMGRYGRKIGFLVSSGMMIAGGLVGCLSLWWQSFMLLNAAHFLLGAALIGINYFRFAAAESVPESKQPRAIGFTLASGIIAAIIGPSIYSATSHAVSGYAYVGAYLSISVIGFIGAIVVAFFAHIPTRKKANTASTKSKSALFSNPDVVFAISSAAITQGMMMLLMTPTALAMVGHGFSEHNASDVIRWHVIAMFAPGLFTGQLIERFGAHRIILTGMIILVASTAVAAVDHGLLEFYVSLILLGIGWNFGFIGGTSLLQSALSEDERPLVQGTNDTILAIASTVASLFSGVLFAGIGWTWLAIISTGVMIGFLVLSSSRTIRA